MGHLQPSFFMAFVKAQTVSETVSADFQTTLCFCPLCKYFLPCTFFIFQCSPPSFFLMAWNYFCFLTVTCSENCFLFLYIYTYLFFLFWWAAGFVLPCNLRAPVPLVSDAGQPVMHRCGNFTEMFPYRQHPNSHLTWRGRKEVPWLRRLGCCLVKSASAKVALNSWLELFYEGI